MRHPSLKTRTSTNRHLVQAFVVVVLLGLLSGCEKKPEYDLLNAGNGLIYRINKNSEEVILITGPEFRKLEEWKEAKKEETKKNFVVEWPGQTVSQLGDVKLSAKTTWRGGKLLYRFQATPYVGRLGKEREKIASQACFNLAFYDSNGFEILSIRQPLAEMSETIDDKGICSGLEANSSIACSSEDYEAIKIFASGWSGFTDAVAP